MAFAAERRSPCLLQLLGLGPYGLLGLGLNVVLGDTTIVSTPRNKVKRAYPSDEPGQSRRRERAVAGPSWTIVVGQSLLRTQLHKDYGGAGQGGMEPSGKSPNVFLFTEKSAGDRFG